MNGKMSPGQRARLAALGRKGTVTNRATAAPRRVELPDGVKLPANAEELADMLGNRESLAKIAANPDVLYSFMAGYGDRAQGDGTELHKTVAAEVESAMIDYLRQNGMSGLKHLDLGPNDPQAAGGKMRTAYAIGAGHNPDAPGAAIDSEFRTSGEFMKAVAQSRAPFGFDAELRGKLEKIQNTYQSIIPSDGGYLIPEVLRSTLLQVAMETAVVRPRATVIPMETLRVAMPAIDTVTDVGTILGGMVAYWTEQRAAMTDTSPKFGQVQLEAKDLTGYSEIPNQLIADSIISLAAFVENVWPKGIAWFEDVAFMKGSGAGEPLGLMGAQNPSSIAVAAESGQATNTILWENIVNMFARMLPSSINNAVWLASIDTFPQLATMALAVGTGGAPVWLNNGVQGPPATILGRPVIFTEKANTVGTRGDLIFADLSYYLIGDRQAMSMAQSTDFRFNQNMTAFRIIERVDGRPWLQSAITPQNGSSNTLSPFVELATRP